MAKPLMSQELISMYRAGKFVSCSNFHIGSCEFKAFHRFYTMAKFFLLFYGPAHILPVLIFKLKELKRNPVPLLLHVGQNTARSVAFGCSILAVIQYLLCQLPKLFNGCTKKNWFIISIAACLPIFIEAPSRRGELALYLAPRAIESLWNVMKKYGFPLRIKYFEVFLFSLAMGILSFFLNNDDKHIKPTYRSTLRHILGNN